MWVDIWLALRYITKHKRRHISFISLISSTGIALGVASLIIVLAVMNGFDKNLQEKLLGFKYHLIAYVSDWGEVNQNILTRLKRIKEVKNAIFFSQLQTVIKKGKTLYPVMFEAIDFNNQELAFWDRYMERGNFNSLIIGKRLAENLGISLGQEVEVISPKSLKPRRFKVSGIFSLNLYEVDNYVVIAPLSRTEGFLKENETLPLVGIRLNNIYQTEKIKREITLQKIEGINYTIGWPELNKALFSALQLEKTTMFVILTFIILVASFNIFATLTIRVVEKIKEIGILKSIGFSPFRIGVIFCLQGLILGIIGIGGGNILGLGLCKIIDKYHLISLPANLYYIDYLPVEINYNDVVLISFTALVLSFVFSFFPSFAASRIKEAKALRYE